MAPSERSAVGALPCHYASDPSSPFSRRKVLRLVLRFIVLTAALLCFFSFLDHLQSMVLDEENLVHNAMSWAWTTTKEIPNACQPPPTNLFAYHPPPRGTEAMQQASNSLDEYLKKRVSRPDTDSIALSVVTPAGMLFVGGYGTLRANESGLAGPTRAVDENSIYRIASISKVFTVLETLIMREKGFLNWDDPVTKYVKNLSLPSESYSWARYLKGIQDTGGGPRVSLRQLASHMGGIRRDFPIMELGEWPIQPENFPSSTNRIEKRAEDANETFAALARLPLVNAPYTYPIYSNTGFGLLGLANSGADALHSPIGAWRTHATLLKRDVFGPLGMSSSFFRAPESEEQRVRMAVPARGAEWADRYMGEFMDPLGGQYSSLNDLSVVMKTLLSPTGAGGVLPAPVVREWLGPLHVWGSGGEHVGAPWEALTLSGVTAYAKGGDIPGYHSQFALVPELSFGIVLLVTGSNVDTAALLKEAAKRYVPAFKTLHEAELRGRYHGKWVSQCNSEDVAEVKVKNGALQLVKLIVDGQDVLDVFERAMSSSGRAVSGAALTKKTGNHAPVLLWPTGREGEFRFGLGRPELNSLSDVGCLPYWVSFDWGVQSRGAPLDLVYWQRGILHYPSAGIKLYR